MSNTRIPLEASRSHLAAGTQIGPDPDPTARMTASILVRRHPGSAGEDRVQAIMRGEVPPLSRAEAAQVLGAEPAELAKVEEFAKSHGLTITSSSPATRMVQVSGTVAQMEAAFGTKIHTCETGGRPYHCYQGALSIPEDLHGIVEGVLGLDQRPVARHLS